MIKNENIDAISLFTPEQKALLKTLVLRNDQIPYIRRWVSTQEQITLSYLDAENIGKTAFYLTNIASESVIECVQVFRNGLLQRSPYKSYGYPWLEEYTNNEFTLDVRSDIQFIPPFQIHLNLLTPFTETDTITCFIQYRALIPGDYNFADAIADLLLKRKRDSVVLTPEVPEDAINHMDSYHDRDFHLYRNVPLELPAVVPVITMTDLDKLHNPVMPEKPVVPEPEYTAPVINDTIKTAFTDIFGGDIKVEEVTPETPLVVPPAE